MPSFFASKAKPALRNSHELESPPNQSTPIKPLRRLNSQTYRDEDDSPLAPFFKADRKERNRLRNKQSGDSGVFDSPTQRPASTSEIPDDLNLRAESPLLWIDSPRKVHGRFDLRSKNHSSRLSMLTGKKLDHSTSDLPFQMDAEYEHAIPARNPLTQRFQTTTETSQHYTAGSYGVTTPNHITQPSKPGMQFSLRRETPSSSSYSDLDTTTQALKNLLSINSPPSHPPTPPFPAMSSFHTRNGPPHPSPIHHNRRVAQSPRKTSPPNPTILPCRRVFSTSGPTPNTNEQPLTYTQSLLFPDRETVTEEERTIKMERELRKVLNLS